MATSDYQYGFLECPSQDLALPDADIYYTPEFLDHEVASLLFESLLEQTQWRQETVTVYGKQHLTPRLSCWMGDADLEYSYSGVTMQPEPWTDTVMTVKTQLEEYISESFNSVLINYYRDGQDSNGWHSDNEPELGPEPVIASLSLGAARDFKLRHRFQKELKHSIALEHGSLLMMRGHSQSHWQHHIPKRAHAGPRINLTFRTVFKIAK